MKTCCWIWTGGRVEGYGTLRTDDVDELAHRISWRLKNGNIPKKLCVLHKCDTRLCIRPGHLWLGTKAENNADMAKKGRANRPVGVLHPKAKLNDAKIRRIRILREKGWTAMDLAEKYEVTATTIRQIVNRTAWSHIL